MSNRRDGKEYEKIVDELGNALFGAAQNNEKYTVKHGSSNKWIGVSKYFHQIDVSAQSSKIILLVECKNWNSNVDVPSFLTFLARVIDIRSKLSDKEVFGKMVTTLDYDRGVKVLASYYNIQLDKVKNKQEFLLTFQQYGIVGVADQAIGIDSVNVSRNCDVCDSALVVKDIERLTYICPNCPDS